QKDVLALCCSAVAFSLLHLSSSLVHGNIQLDEGRGAADTLRPPTFLTWVKRPCPDRVHDPTLLPVDSVEDHFLMDTGSYDEDSSAALQLQGRAMRSLVAASSTAVMSGLPAALLRPLRHCYCRFFNAICYCRRVGHACPPRRTECT
uniref:Agouti domain-containing protein n=1 Tax=Seriola dumerili TaxID=41447 RepID=A0A3B4TYK6_SERDU